MWQRWFEGMNVDMFIYCPCHDLDEWKPTQRCTGLAPAALHPLE